MSSRVLRSSSDGLPLDWLFRRSSLCLIAKFPLCIRNMSFMPENEGTMANSKRLIESLVEWIEDHETGKIGQLSCSDYIVAPSTSSSKRKTVCFQKPETEMRIMKRKKAAVDAFPVHDGSCSYAGDVL